MTKPAPITTSVSEAVSNVGHSATQNVTLIHLAENCDANDNNENSGNNDINGIIDRSEINDSNETNEINAI